MSMKIALSSRYDRKAEVNEAATLFQGVGFEVTSVWHAGKDDGYYGYNAKYNLGHIDEADVLVCFAEDPEELSLRGGRHVDFGYALGKGKLVVAIQAKTNYDRKENKEMPVAENIYHLLSNVVRVKSLAEAVTYLYKRREAPVQEECSFLPAPPAPPDPMNLTFEEFFHAFMDTEFGGGMMNMERRAGNVVYTVSDAMMQRPMRHIVAVVDLIKE